MAAAKSKTKPKAKKKPKKKAKPRVRPEDRPTFAQACVFLGLVGLSACAIFSTFAYGDDHALTWTEWGRYAIRGSVGLLGLGLAIMIIGQAFTGWTNGK